MNGYNLDFDAIVIGSGTGGLCAAARLSRLGYRTLVAESRDRIGGRASTRAVDGFLCNDGALVIELDGAVARTCSDLGIPFHVCEPDSASTVIRIGKRYINVTEGPGGWLRNVVPRVLSSATKLLPWLRPRKGQSLASWLNRITRNRAVHALVNNTVGAMFAASADDLPADVFLHYFAKDTSFKKIGMPPGGTIEVWKPLADFVEAGGGQVWLNSTVSQLTFGADGLVNGAMIDRRGEGSRKVVCRVAVSNAGPMATVKLCGAENLPIDYVRDVVRSTNPAAIITVHFASRTPLADFPCLALYSKTRRLVYAANFSAPHLGRAPEGWYLYCGASVPRPARGRFGLEQEKALLFDDLRDLFPGFDQARILAIDVTAHDWPAQRAITGYDLPHTTPVANLWNVGDGVKPWGSAGTAACAESARIVVEEIAARFPAPSPIRF